MAWKALLSRPVAGSALGLWLGSAVALASPAAALTLGSLAPPDLGGCGNCNVVQRKSAPGEPSYEVLPGKWTITSWSAQGGGSADGKARIRIYRPTATKGQYRLVRQSAYETVPADGHPVLPTNLKVRGGDLVGLYTKDNVPSAHDTGLAKNFVWGVCDAEVGELVGVGTACELAPLKGYLVNAEVTLSKL